MASRGDAVNIQIEPAAALPADFDHDGIPDHEDNCILVPNGPLDPDAGANSQLDTDGDGYGNICDAGFNGDGQVNLSDFSITRASFGSAPGPSGLNP